MNETTVMMEYPSHLAVSTQTRPVVMAGIPKTTMVIAVARGMGYAIAEIVPLEAGGDYRVATNKWCGPVIASAHSRTRTGKVAKHAEMTRLSITGA